MALLSLLFNKPKKFSINVKENLDALENNEERNLLIIDVTTTITHNYKATPSKNPIEDGSFISDHVDKDPEGISISGIISEAPIGITQAILGNVAGVVGGAVSKAIGSPLGGAIAAGGLATLGGKLLDTEGSRVQDAFNALLEIREKNVLLTLQTGLKSYTNMIMTSFIPTEEAKNGSSLVFTASFERIELVSSDDTVIIPKESKDSRASAAKKQNGGKKVAKETTEQNKTIAKNLFDKFF